jgi:ubiquinone/menaquinone biosynthesis C-methylase UbiE
MTDKDQLTEFDRRDAKGATATSTVTAERFDRAYEGTPPWDIGKPQEFFAALVDAETIRGKVLDIGCGTGSDTLYYASRGLDVIGLDASGVAIERARAKAREQGASVEFIQGDALQLTQLSETYDTVVDCGLLHVFSDDDMQRLINEVRAVLRPSGHYVVACFSDEATLNGPRKLTKDELHALFREGWRIESIEPVTLGIVPGRAELRGADDAHGAAAWLAVIQRTAL